MKKQDNLMMIVLTLGLLSLSSLAQAGGFTDEGVPMTTIGSAGIGTEIIAKEAPKGSAYGRCKEDKKDKKKKPCASSS